MSPESINTQPGNRPEKPRAPLNIEDAIARLQDSELFIGAQKIAQASEEEQRAAAVAFFAEAGQDALLIEKLGIMLSGTAFINKLQQLANGS